MAYFGLVGEAATLVGISASYVQSGSVYTNTPLDFLRTDLTVTATYDNGQTLTVTSYTLSGTLTEGTSTITVSYNGKTDTFNVTVSEAPVVGNLYEWDFTQSVTDLIRGEVATLEHAYIIPGTGVRNDVDTVWGYVKLFPSKDYNFEGKTIELNVQYLSGSYYDSMYGDLLLVNYVSGEYGEMYGAFGPDSSVAHNWTATRRNHEQSYTFTTSNQLTFTDCTFKFIFTSNHMVVTVNDELFYEGGTIMDGECSIQICNRWGDFIITGLKIYQNV